MQLLRLTDHILCSVRRYSTNALVSFIVSVVSANTMLYADELTDGEKLFALKVQPVLAAKCASCHGDDPEDLGGDFDIRTRESMLKGGESFAEDVVVSGEGEASLLYRVVAHSEEGFEMPPKLADRLSEQQTWWIRDWINAGAPWPSDEQIAQIQKQHADGEQVLTSKALSEDWQNRRYESQKLWAYRPLQAKEVPKDEHPVNWFINRKLAAAELSPAQNAPATAMARRMSFGLTGLPPKPQAIREFVAAYERDPRKAVGDFGRQLMGSPHYGERFGQHWLDVTRYADSSGYANDYARPNAWRYRDYVVRSFNTDKPFDLFVKEQIAGDEIDSKNSESLIATGFLRMGPWELTGMSVFKEMRQFWLDDVTDSVGQTFLAHAMQCAKCHDHKFDPVPTRDYYGMMAVFSTTQFAERHAPFLQSESQANFDAANEWVQQKLAYYNADMKELDTKMAKLQKAEQGAAKVGDNGLDPGDEASQSRIRKNISRHEIEKDRTLPFAHSVYTGKTIAIKNAKSRWTIPKDRWGKGYFDPDVIYTGGSVYSPGEAVVPGALSAAEVLGEMDVKAFPTGEGKRRLALANWIADPKNPLTARVIVNRVWSWHFGKGIAGNPNNFGGTGGVPSHPELLDFLANWFMENGWSIKKLNQLIITSDAYRRSSQHPEPEELATLDPRNKLYASFQPRRLDAEELRDAMLLVSGELNNAVGGIPARPDINPDVAVQPLQIMGNTASAYEPYPMPDQRNRRSLYAERLRGLRDPFLETFNQPGLDDSCERRETSTIAPQALTMLNAEEVHDRSLALAARLVREGGSDKDILRSAFTLTFGRPATDIEIASCLDEWKIATAEEAKLHPKPRQIQTVIERTVMAEKTGEPYTFIEHLPAYESYVPDLQRSDVDARTRGLSHICLVLFNSNEFSYLD